MSIVSTVQSPPRVQASGQHRGAIAFTLDDGREITRNVRAPDLASYNELGNALEAGVLESVQNQDSEELAQTDGAIGAHKQATAKQVARLYLERAMGEDDPHLSFKKLNRFNDYRISQGWTLNQVATGLGIDSGHWDEAKARFQYLNSAENIATMNAYEVLRGSI